MDYIHYVSESLQEVIKPYAHLGVSVDKVTGLMMYNRQPVREIWDDVAGTIITESIGSNGFAGRNIPGAADLTTIYENGVLIGFHVSTQEEYDKRTEERQVFTSSDNTVNAAERFEKYKEFDARDIEIIKNPSPLTAYSASENVPQSPHDGNVANANSGAP